ncbi:MAG: N-acetylneuraminate synthase [Candidatus Wallbacteria bacterium HGW-Wallbacteria-1]|jgi:N-acetylneuraminate synthase|uniref:N-acetylneuraminate synthase n=1 Tax=Candidatus Wallbacteria bacterium HGW-Wallbacteria-1 TaxID=2013854 RepID=A0A2N1PK97_9BACT|nr:MAG: N-acetylneuraminate synthase [Candidatus Wallbacteria bacterium HGW-Wallbacteria-1]
MSTDCNESQVLIIAEAGVNHNGSLQKALEMVDAAADAGADIIKFQTFKAVNLVTADAAKADYQKVNTGGGSQLEMLSALELDDMAHEKIIERCRQRDISFLSTPFDIESVHFLKSLDMKIFKIPSGEITNLPYLRLIGSLGVEIILSTGMSTLGEVEQAIDIIELAGTPPSDITLLHCTTEYPAPMSEVNLMAMLTMASAFPAIRAIGYSDHTQGIEIPVAAVALGATVIEKHFTLDRSLPGPDHAASLEPDELAAMVKAIRNVSDALGDGSKKPTPSESGNRNVARKSIVAARAISRGQTITEDMITAKRPGTGISPMRWDEVVGSIASRDFLKDQQIV